MSGRLRLGQFFVLSLVGLGLMLAALLAVVERGSRHTIGVAAGQVMEQAAQQVATRVKDHFAEAERVLMSFEARRGLGVELGAALAAELGPHPQVSAVSLTFGRALGYWEEDGEGHLTGELHLAPDGRGAVTVSRGPDQQLVVRRVSLERGAWRGERHSAGGGLLGVDPAIDPTLDDTFVGPARRDQRDRTLWSDLSIDPSKMRVVTVQKALWNGDHFAGVLKVVLLSERIDAFTQVALEGHRVFLFDQTGRLVSRLNLADPVAIVNAQGQPDPKGDDVRVLPVQTPPEVAALLQSPLVHELAPGTSGSVRFDAGGRSYLASVTAFPENHTWNWLVGIVAPESLYLRDLAASRRWLVAGAAAVMLLILAGGALVLRALRRDLGGLIGETARLGAFDFAPSPPSRAAFIEVGEAGASLEKAKAALRALGKYAPVDLVRQLFEARLEPVLGARIQDVTMMFSDIAGFTTVAEEMPTADLAAALGDYLEAMTGAVHSTGGIIDKYLGDGVMALWNAPARVPEHPRQACAAVLRCQAATTALFASPAWSAGGRRPWYTRFGLHRDQVSVGHFGAPDRMSYTAMGDGVNLAARLESLNKQYGTQVLVSASVAHAAGEGFAFRRIDRVAVKGKRDGVDIFELVGQVRTAEHATYEAALDAYFQRRFEQALQTLGGLTDGPAQVLAARCRAYLREPPPAEWTGVHVALEK